MASYFDRVFKPCYREYLQVIPGKKTIGGCFKLLWNLIKPNALTYPDLVCVLTTHCSLKCKHCNNLIPCYKEPYHVPADEIISDINTVLSHTDICVKLALLGGEPFVYPEIGKVIDAFKDHPKVMCLDFATNATVIPNDEILDKIASAKNPKIIISDYGVSTQKVKEFAEVCRKKGIFCEVCEDKTWRLAGGTECRNKDKDKLIKEYDSCYSSRYCRTLLNGKIYTCARAASLVDMGYMDGTHDSFDIRKERTDKEFRKEMREFLTIDYAEACNYCDHDKKIAIPAGEQLP